MEQSVGTEIWVFRKLSDIKLYVQYHIGLGRDCSKGYMAAKRIKIGGVLAEFGLFKAVKINTM